MKNLDLDKLLDNYIKIKTADYGGLDTIATKPYISLKELVEMDQVSFNDKIFIASRNISDEQFLEFEKKVHHILPNAFYAFNTSSILFVTNDYEQKKVLNFLLEVEKEYL